MQENRRRRRSISSREGRLAPSNDSNVENKLSDQQADESGKIGKGEMPLWHPQPATEIPALGPDATPEEVAEYYNRLEIAFEEWCETTGVDDRATKTMKEALQKNSAPKPEE